MGGFECGATLMSTATGKSSFEPTHIDRSGNPTLVDIAAKAVTLRHAVAGARVTFPSAVGAKLLVAGFIGKKGAILHTAIIAGVMAAKRTHELIPFCHALALERCDIRITPDAFGNLDIVCECALSGKTGVEMEAITGATIAALTVYDMTKAMSLEIAVCDIRLLQKSGGKRTHGRAQS
jgi:cyclic pyranopterin monophosphate synthase